MGYRQKKWSYSALSHKNLRYFQKMSTFALQFKNGGVVPIAIGRVRA